LAVGEDEGGGAEIAFEVFTVEGIPNTDVAVGRTQHTESIQCDGCSGTSLNTGEGVKGIEVETLGATHTAVGGLVGICWTILDEVCRGE
jgi:hypothetical protein